MVSVGTHDILFCAIEAIHRHTTPYGLVWFDRSYHALMRPAINCPGDSSKLYARLPRLSFEEACGLL